MHPYICSFSSNVRFSEDVPWHHPNRQRHHQVVQTMSSVVNARSVDKPSLEKTQVVLEKAAMVSGAVGSAFAVGASTVGSVVPPAGVASGAIAVGAGVGQMGSDISAKLIQAELKKREQVRPGLPL